MTERENLSESDPAQVITRARPAREPLGAYVPLVVLSSMAFIASLGVSVMVPLIPLYAVSLGASPMQLGLLTSGFALANALGQFGGGSLNERVGSRGFVRIGIAIYAGANLLIASAFDALSLIAFRSLAGLGAGFNVVSQRLYIAETTKPQRMAFANSVLSAAASAGQVLGPAIGGIIVALADLRFLFITVGVTSAVEFLASWLLPKPAEKIQTSRHTEPAPTLNRAAIVLLISQVCLLAGYGSFITTYAPLAKTILGWETLQVGIVFSFFGLGSILLGPALAHYADRVGHKWLAMIACLPLTLFGIGLVLAMPRVAIYAIAFASGGGLTAYTGAWFAMLAQASGARRGRTFGIVNAISQLGIVAGAMLASLIWQSVGLPPALLAASAAIFLAGATLFFLPRAKI